MEGKQFVNSDFYTTAFLITRGYKLIKIDKSNSRRFRFVLEDQPGRTKLLEDFFNYKTLVEPRKFIASIKELKSSMYSDAFPNPKMEYEKDSHRHN